MKYDFLYIVDEKKDMIVVENITYSTDKVVISQL